MPELRGVSPGFVGKRADTASRLFGGLLRVWLLLIFRSLLGESDRAGARFRLLRPFTG